MYHDLLSKLIGMSDIRYKEFSSALIPGCRMIGVRLPLLRSVAKDILKNNRREFLECGRSDIFEITMLRAMVISGAECEISEKLRLTAAFVPEIDNWSVCDSFCQGFRFFEKDSETVFDFVLNYAGSDNEFDLRFCAVMLLDHFIDDGHILQVLNVLDGLCKGGYYAKMAVAWALSVCFIKQKSTTLEYLNNSGLDDFTYNKALQKIIESRRISGDERDLIRSLKRK